MPLRVLHLTTEFPPIIYGGLGTAVGGWVKASARAGINVAVQLVEGPLVLEDGGTAYGSPINARAAHMADPAVNADVPFFQASWADAIETGIRAVRVWRPDILHLHTAMLWHVAAAIRAATGTPIVYHVHSVDRAEYEIGEEPSPWLAHSLAQEQAIAASDRLIALTRSEGELLARYFPESSEKVRIVGNGIEDTETARAIAFRGRHSEAVTILYSGRLVERKGIRELLAAVPEVLMAAPKTVFVFVGGPPPLRGSEVAAQWLGGGHARFAGRIRFTGWLSPQRVAEWYELADILVVPSRYEPFGMVILEGMLYGLPIVAADTGGPAEILEHGRTGLLFPARDAKALGDALQRLISSPRERQRLGRAGASDVRSRWLWAQQVPAMQKCYQEILSPFELSSA
jgi:glycosyltransferase involved in cell wall biosynthesis